jgi:small-conductance mechanosensitive channel
MSLKDIIAFKIIDTSNWDLSVYNLMALVIIFISIKISLIIIKRIFRRLERQDSIDIGTSHAISKIIKYVLWIIAILLMLDSLGLKVTILLASSAALMVGLGLGLQQIFQDFLSGITVLIEGSLKVNDIIQTQNGEVGMVKQIGLRTSKLETRDNIILIIPNSKLINESLVNWSHIANTTRFEVTVGVAYGSDIDKIKSLLLSCANQHELVEKIPEPSVFFSDFGDSSLDFRLLFYTNQTFRVEAIKSDLRFSIENVFRENDVKIPFPQRDVHFYPNK